MLNVLLDQNLASRNYESFVSLLSLTTMIEAVHRKITTDKPQQHWEDISTMIQ